MVSGGGGMAEVEGIGGGNSGEMVVLVLWCR